MKASKTVKTWGKTRRQSLWRHRNGGYYARLFHSGKEIWRSLKTKNFSVAEARLDTQLAEHRTRREISRAGKTGPMTFGDALVIAQRQLSADPELKPATHKFHDEVFAAILKSWPELKTRPINKISKAEITEWTARHKANVSATRFNAALTAMRRVFKVAMDSGALFSDPAAGAKRGSVRQKKLELPSRQQFLAMLEIIRTAGGRFSRAAADFVAGLAFTGMRTGEAKQLRWQDVNIHGGPRRSRDGHQELGDAHNSSHRRGIGALSAHALRATRRRR